MAKSKTPIVGERAQNLIIMFVYNMMIDEMLQETTEHRIRQGIEEDFWQYDHEIADAAELTEVEIAEGLSQRRRGEIMDLAWALAVLDGQALLNVKKWMDDTREFELGLWNLSLGSPNATITIRRRPD